MRLLISVGIAALLLTLPGTTLGQPASAPRTDDQPAWASRVRVSSNWQVIAYGVNDRSITYASEATPAQTSRLWWRTEYRDPEGTGAGAHLSIVMLVVLDCPGQRWGIVQATTYSGQNLTGTADTGTNAVTPPMEAVVPNSIAAAFTRWGCNLNTGHLTPPPA